MYCKTSPNSGGLGLFYKHTVVIVSSGSYCKPHAGWLINNIISFLPVLWPGSPSSGCQHGQVLVRPFLYIADCWLFLVSARGGEQREEASSPLSVKYSYIRVQQEYHEQLATWTTNKKGEVARGLYFRHLWMKAYFSLDWYWTNWYWSKGRLLIHVEMERKLWFDNRQVASSSFTITKMTCSFSSQLFN